MQGSAFFEKMPGQDFEVGSIRARSSRLKEARQGAAGAGLDLPSLELGLEGRIAISRRGVDCL